MSATSTIVSRPPRMRYVLACVAFLALSLMVGTGVVLEFRRGHYKFVLFAFPLLIMVASFFTATVVMLYRLPRKQITIDIEREVVIFEHVLVPMSFWPLRPIPRVVCPFSDIVDVYEVTGRGGSNFKILTTAGRVWMSSDWTNYAELRGFLYSLTKDKPAGPLSEEPWLLMIIGTAAVILILAAMFGWFFLT